MNKREHKSFDVEFKADEKGMFEGYAAYFGNKDSYGDVILPSAFAETIAEAKTNGYKDIKIFWNHDWSGVPIGKPTEMYEDSKGLYIKGQLNNTATALDVKEGLKTGSISKMSIGYFTQEDRMEKVDGAMARLLVKIKLFEFSPVNFPANDMADITNYKSEQLGNVEKLLKDAVEKIAIASKNNNVEFKEINTTQTLHYLIKEKVKESMPNMVGSLSVSSNCITLDQFVFNNWLYTDNGVGDFDKYYRQGYVVNNGAVELVGDPVEVQSVRSFVDKKGEKLEEQEKKEAEKIMEAKVIEAINKLGL